MKKDRRHYSRIAVSIDAVVFVPDKDKDIPCRIVDIGERGLRFKLPIKYGKYFKKGNTVVVQFVDFLKNNQEENVIITENARVQHTEGKDDDISVGCYVVSAEFTDYFIKKIAENYGKILEANFITDLAKE